MSFYGRFPEYVSVGERKEKIAKKVAKLKKQKVSLNPIIVEGRTLTKNFWGKAWCDNIESYKDYEYRLDRGRAYVRHGAVIDLKVSAGNVEALVCGTRTYTVKISIKPLPTAVWKALIKECSGKINSLIELLQGNFPQAVMDLVTHREKGLFPKSNEITFNCTCPDHASLCKHVSAVLYGIGIRFDKSPDYLFMLRDVDHTKLFSKAAHTIVDIAAVASSNAGIEGDLSDIFGIQFADVPAKKTKKRTASKAAKTVKKKRVSKEDVKIQSVKKSEKIYKKNNIKNIINK